MEYRGQYRWVEAEVTEHHGLVLATAVVPRGVICLLSALQFHGIGTQLPHQVWIALDPRVRKPALSYPPIRMVRFSGRALTAGLSRRARSFWKDMDSGEDQEHSSTDRR